MMRSQAAGHKHPDLILLIHSMDIFREPALIPAVKPAQKRNDHLAAVVVSADHQIHVPDLARISEDEAVRAVGKLPVMADISWIPFASGLTFPTVLNLVMFLPLGFLLPVLWDRFRSFGRVLTVGFLCSLVLELGQLFNFRATDLEDLLMNTAGAAAGFLLWLLLMKLLGIKIRWKGLRSGSFLVRHEMEFLMIFAFLGHFFLS